MNKNVCESVVIENIKLNHNNFLIVLKPKIIVENIQPGQFVNVQIKDSPTTFLRRPFSISDVDYEKNAISMLVKIAGLGSKKLTEVLTGDSLDIIFPLGKGFTRPKPKEKVLLVGGGVGIAPLLFLARESKEIGADINILLGARSKQDHILIDDFKKLGNVSITTDDGSYGTKGLVIDHDIFGLKPKFDRIHSCGPEPMMKAVAQKARLLDIECEVSLENMMACGFGVCLCCVTKTTDGNRCVCTDGPVFNIKELKW
jgi:dihydroorotate dehydrogenase electron transfer subunit